MATMIFGTVYDSGSTVLTGATVSLPGLSVINSSGTYYVVLPGAGTYQLTASCSGYIAKLTPVTIVTGQTKSQDFHLVHV